MTLTGTPSSQRTMDFMRVSLVETMQPMIGTDAARRAGARTLAP